MRDESILDGEIVVDPRTSLAASKELTQQDGTFAGVTAGAVIRSGQRVAERLDAGHTRGNRRPSRRKSRRSRTRCDRSGGPRSRRLARIMLHTNSAAPSASFPSSSRGPDRSDGLITLLSRSIACHQHRN